MMAMPSIAIAGGLLIGQPQPAAAVDCVGAASATTNRRTCALERCTSSRLQYLCSAACAFEKTALAQFRIPYVTL